MKKNTIRLAGYLAVILILVACGSVETPPWPPTSTFVPAPTKTPLPPLPDFQDMITYGLGGGGISNCMVPEYQPPVIYGTRNTWQSVAGICGYQIPIPMNTPIHVTVSSGMYVLDGVFQFIPYFGDDGNFHGSIDWFESHSDSYSLLADSCTENSCTYMDVDLWWPVGLPDGTWQLRLSWSGEEFTGDFNAGINTLPALSVIDSTSYQKLRGIDAGKQCHKITPDQDLRVYGIGLAYNSIIYLPIYEETSTVGFFRHFDTQLASTDHRGMINVNLNGPFQPGKSYMIAATTDPDPNINFNANPSDCFTVR